MHAMKPAGLLLACLLAPAGMAQTPAPETAPAATTIAPVVVTGVQPGPRLWKVSRDGHAMWVIGMQSPLPKGIEWAPGEAAARIRSAGVVLRPPMVHIGAEIGFFSSLALVPSAMSARKNPDGKTLSQVLPPDLYARWLPLKQRYLGKDRGVEKLRPILAAGELWSAAIKRSGLSARDVVWEVVEDIADDADVPVTRPTVSVKLEDPKKMLKQLKQSSLDDAACFERTLTRLESDVDAMRRRASAWAVGDLAALRALPHVDAAGACQSALLSASVVQERGLGDLPARAEAAWVEAAEKALTEHERSFAMLPISDLLDPSGYLGNLKAKGYLVEEGE